MESPAVAHSVRQESPFPFSALQPVRRVYSRLARPLVSLVTGRHTSHTRIEGVSLEVPPGVFHPGLFGSSRFLAGWVVQQELEGKVFLDMGTGSGVIGIVAERRGASVTAVDINPLAVHAAAANARANGCRNFRAVRSDLFSGLPEESLFDLVAWNPPYYAADPETPAQHAWYAGARYGTIRRFAAGARCMLTPGGYVLLAVSSDMDLPLLLRMLEDEGWRVSLESARRGLFEDFLLLKARPFSRSLP